MLFYCFEAFWGKFTENFSFWSQKWLFQKRAQKYSESVFFLTCLKRGKSWGEIGFVWTNIFDQTSKREQILTKTVFSPQSETHTAKLYFSVVLKNFRGNSQRNSLFSPKSDHLRKSREIHRIFVFLNMFEKGKILRKIGICLKNCF